MSMQRSDLPHVAKLAPEVQRQAIDAMWRAYLRAEKSTLEGPYANYTICPPSYVATMVEILEAALETLDPFTMVRAELGLGSGAGTGPHPHNAPEQWRDDGKCIWKSCRHWRTVAEFESHWRQITSTNDIPPGEYILAGLCPEHRGYRLLPDGQCPVPSGITPGIGHTPGAS